MQGLNSSPSSYSAQTQCYDIKKHPNFNVSNNTFSFSVLYNQTNTFFATNCEDTTPIFSDFIASFKQNILSAALPLILIFLNYYLFMT